MAALQVWMQKKDVLTRLSRELSKHAAELIAILSPVSWLTAEPRVIREYLGAVEAYVECLKDASRSPSERKNAELEYELRKKELHSLSRLLVTSADELADTLM